MLYFGLPADSHPAADASSWGSAFRSFSGSFRPTSQGSVAESELLMLANIGGSVVGTIVTGWVALDLLGTAGTLRAIAAVSTVFMLTAVVLG